MNAAASDALPAVFTFPDTGHAVRIVTLDGTPWWVAADVCLALGIQNARRAVAEQLDDDEVRTAYVTDTMGRQQQAYVVNEPGLYSLILRSRKPQARAFKRWVTHEVLPQIRTTGAYAPAGTTAAGLPDLSRPDGVLALAEQFVATARALVTESERVAELEPKAAAHDAYLSAHDSDRLIREVAKLLGLRESWLRGFLADQRLIFPKNAPCGHRYWDTYAAHRQHFRPTETVVQHNTGGPCAHYTLRVTPRGVEYIRRKLQKEGVGVRDESAAA